MMTKRIDVILEDTKKLSLPVLADECIKQDIIENEKKKIDSSIEFILSENKGDINKFVNHKDTLWENAKADSEEYFENLPGRLKINSFYFQEVMHRYVEYIKEFILNE